jgi:hypothetical protein
MALKINGKVKLHLTGVEVKEAYLRVVTINNPDGTQQAKFVSYLTKDHYRNASAMKIAQINIVLDFGFKLEPVATADLQEAHQQFQKQFEANSFNVEIVDL